MVSPKQNIDCGLLEMSQVTTFTVVGDSAASGVGDALPNGTTVGWSYYLAKSFEEPLVFLNASRPGAKSLEVLEDQIPKVLVHKPDICGVIVGSNDMLRNGFNPVKLHSNLRATLGQLQQNGTTALMLELHDPTKIVPMPKLLARVLNRRVDAVNQVTRAVANEFGAILVNTRSMPNIYKLENWHIDRMHPSKIGHQRLAAEFRFLLVQSGWNLGPVEVDQVVTRNRKESIIWMLRNGTPWFLKRSVDLLPAALFLMVVELINIKLNRIPATSSENVWFPSFANLQDFEDIEISELRVS
jgi:lysophospholipase L1-like esterase